MQSRTLTLADGRTLSWAELGTEFGAHVVVANQGASSSRLEIAIYDKKFAAMDLHVIAPERPGYGLSSPIYQSRTVGDWADDVRCLVDHLGIDSFAVSGMSAGGPYALAIAAASMLSARVSRVLLRASIAPGQEPRTERDREIADRAQRLSWDEFEASFELEPETDLPFAPADETALADPAYLEAFITSFAEGARQGSRGIASDAWATTRPWGFEFSAITQRVDIWHGDSDTLAPVTHAYALDALLPNASLRIVPGAGHFSIDEYVPEQFAAIRAITQ